MRNLLKLLFILLLNMPFGQVALGDRCSDAVSKLRLHPMSDGGIGPSSPQFSSRDLARLVSIKLGIKDRATLENAFEKRKNYFGNLRTVTEMEDRLEQLVETKPNIDFNLALRDAPESQVDSLLLLLTRPSLKGIVWENAVSNREQLHARGIDPVRFWNQHDPNTMYNLVQECETHLGKQFVDSNLNPALTFRVGHTWKEFEASPELRNIYADEIAQALTEVLEKRKSAYPMGSPKHAFAEQTLHKLGANEDVQFAFTSRDLESFIGGKLAGDCTRLGEDNDWTLGAWNLTFENMELRVKVKGKFFARVLLIAGEREDQGHKPVLFAHAIEFSPLARPGEGNVGSYLSDPQVQKDALEKMFRFLNDHAHRAGFDDVLVTQISNSGDYHSMMEDFVGKSGMTKEGTRVRLLNPLDSAHSIQRRVGGAGSDEPIRFLLQDWQAGTNFARGKQVDFSQATAVTLRGQTIQAADLTRASNLFVHFIDDARQKKIKKLKQIEVLLNQPAVSPRADFEDILMRRMNEARALGELSDETFNQVGLNPNDFSEMDLEALLNSRIDELEITNDLCQEIYNPAMRNDFTALLRKNGFKEADITALAESPKEMAKDYADREYANREYVVEKEKPTAINSPVSAYSLKAAFARKN